MTTSNGQAAVAPDDLHEDHQTNATPARNRILAALRELTAHPDQAKKVAMLTGYFTPFDIKTVSDRLERERLAAKGETRKPYARTNTFYILNTMAREGLLPYIQILRGKRVYYQYALPVAGDPLYTPNQPTPGHPAEPLQTFTPDTSERTSTSKPRGIYLEDEDWTHVGDVVRQLRDRNIEVEVVPGEEPRVVRTSSELVRVAIARLMNELAPNIQQLDAAPTAHERLFSHLIPASSDDDERAIS